MSAAMAQTLDPSLHGFFAAVALSKQKVSSDGRSRECRAASPNKTLTK